MMKCGRILTVVVWAVTSCIGKAGGSGLNTLVVVNQNSSNSLALGNYFVEKRAVPPQNVIRINWTGGNTTWTLADFENVLRTPVTEALAERQLTNQIDFIVLSMDIPYRVHNPSGVANNFNSTTATMFYGFKENPMNPMTSCSLPPASTSLYAGSESAFRQTPPISAMSNSWLTFMLTASNLAQAKALVDRGVTSDFSHPTAPVVLARGSDRLRNVRHYLFDNAIIDARILNAANIVRTNVENPNALGAISGFQGGAQVFSPVGNYAAGALADSLTSFSGYLFENSGHTDVLDILNAGATASYGTIVEPCSYFAKFPVPQLYFYQSRGFTAAESYFLSVTNPYQGVMVGEPLAAPFAQPGNGAWNNLSENAALSGMVNLNLSFTASSPARPVQQVDLFLDGQFLHSVSNLPPREGNVLTVTLNGFTTNYTVPANATLQSIASNLALRLNANSFSNATKVVAFARGDRIELRSLDINRSGANTTLSVSSSVGSASVLTTHAVAARPTFLDKLACGLRSFAVTNSNGTNVPAGAWLLATVIKTNGVVVNVGVTNSNPEIRLRLFARELFDAINAHPELTTPDGVVVENVNMHEDPGYAEFIYGLTDFSGEFDVYARASGWSESQVRVRFAASPGISFFPGSTNRLDENQEDLRPRNHLYIAAGLPNWNLTAPFNTTTNADGYHELTAVAYEGTHVRTQTRISRKIQIQNHSWSGTLAATAGVVAGEATLDATLQFLVNVTTGGITNIELFSTGGLLAEANNVSSAAFPVAADYFGAGTHPFYAVLKRDDGTQFRTDAVKVRLIDAESPFTVDVQMDNDVPTLTWAAIPGRLYQILSTTNLTQSFQLRATVTPPDTLGTWTEPDSSAGQRFYRIVTP